MKLFSLTTFLVLVGTVACQQLDYDDYYNPDEVVSELQAGFMPGMIGELDLSVIQKAKTMYFNFILSYLKEIEVPRTDFKGGHIYDSVAFVEEAPTDVDLVTVRTKNAVKLSVKNMRVGFKSEDLWFRSGLIVARGSVDAVISNVSMEVSISLGSQKLPDGRMVPQVTVPDFKMVLPKEHIDIKIHGNVVVSFANSFKKFFINTLTGSITKLI